MNTLAPSELILRPDGSIYHLHLQPDQVATTCITVGDPARVARVSQHFDRIDERVESREFVTHTGELNGKRLTVISTGIGTDNVDIVVNEYDALFNIDFKQRTIREDITKIDFIRLGTSGAFQPDLPLDSFLLSSAALAFDGLLPFYRAEPNDHFLSVDLRNHLLSAQIIPPISINIEEVEAPRAFQNCGLPTGVTISASGFYAPQGRSLRVASRLDAALLSSLRSWQNGKYRITNIEMETSGLFGLAHALGHRATSLSVLLANRAEGTFSQRPADAVSDLIEKGLEIIVSE